MADEASEPNDPDSDPIDSAPAAETTEGAMTTEAATAEATDHMNGRVTTASTTDIEQQHGDLLGEFARAMHLAATSQYQRINAELERRREEQVEAIAARAGAEVENLKAGSEADIGAIDAWARTETEKIKLERLRRIDTRREQLTSQLERQDTIKEREVAAIQGAIDAHRTEMDLFFGRMERETDPATIALVASTIPPFPQLADIAETARRTATAEFAGTETTAETAIPDGAISSAAPASEPAGTEASPATADLETNAPEAVVTESRLMAVMDPEATRTEDGQPAHPWDAPSVVSVAAGTGDETSGAEPEAPSRVGSTLLRTVRAIRPMTDRHDHKSGGGDAQP